MGHTLSQPVKPARQARPEFESEAAFDVQAFLATPSVSRRIIHYAAGEVVFTQGVPANSVFYLQDGSVKLTVLSPNGKEAVVALLGPGDFLGEGCLLGQSQRIGSAAAVAPTTATRIPKSEMLRTLHDQSTLSDLFIGQLLTRNMRIEEDLVDQLFNSCEKRLARTLLLLAHYGKQEGRWLLPRLSQDTLAKMVGTSRSRVNFFLNKFRKLGFIEYNDSRAAIKSSLLSVVLRD